MNKCYTCGGPAREDGLGRMYCVACNKTPENLCTCDKVCGIDECLYPITRGGPRHQPSPRCKSGGHTHCTCDTCF